MTILRVENLRTHFKTPRGTVRAVEGVSFSIRDGETLALVGESGSGKSVTSLSIMGLIDSRIGTSNGSITLDGRELLGLSENEMEKVRGRSIGMIFQEPMSSLNPVFTVGWQVAEMFRLHRGASKAEAWREAVKMLELVGIPAPERRAQEYPHQLSGGMRQRVVIAIALACEPSVLIADEPTTALDVTTQAQILDLIRSLQTRLGSAVLLITHDLGVVAETADRVAVMYAGSIVESGNVRDVIDRPRHPYTQGLLAAVPEISDSDGAELEERPLLKEIPGMVPSLTREIIGCAFASRCDRARDNCHAIRPELRSMTNSHNAACHYPTEYA